MFLHLQRMLKSPGCQIKSPCRAMRRRALSEHHPILPAQPTIPAFGFNNITHKFLCTPAQSRFFSVQSKSEVHVLLLNLRRYTRCGEFGFLRPCAGFNVDISRRNYPYCLYALAHRNHVRDNLHVLMTVTWRPTTGSNLDFIDHS